jgi:hypothetical protein
VRELSVEARKAAPDCGLYLWADMINPFGGLKMPEDPPTAAAELLEPELRGKMTLIVRIGECDEDARGMMNASATSLPARGYRVAGWADGRGAAARAWAVAFRAAAEGAKTLPAGDKAPEAPAGLVLDLRSARTLDLEAFAEAAWNGAPALAAKPPDGK